MDWPGWGQEQMGGSGKNGNEAGSLVKSWEFLHLLRNRPDSQKELYSMGIIIINPVQGMHQIFLVQWKSKLKML